MSPATLLRNTLRSLIPLAVACTFYLYLYPVFLGCAFPLPQTEDNVAAFQDTVRQHVLSNSSTAAPFRLLALGDPQLEGDTSIPNYNRESFPHLTWAIRHLTYKTDHPSLRKRLRQVVHDIVDIFFDDIPDTFESIRKRIDLFGNDFYLAHIYRTLRWWTKPTHVTVLGDLLGSQWIKEKEFNQRSWRFWNRSFKGGERVPDEVAAYPAEEYDLAGFLGVEDDNSAAWRRRIINVAGNHDVGYAGDLTVERLERFERVFGKAAYELRFELPITNPAANATIYNEKSNPDSDRLAPELRILNVNNMNLDTPAADQSLQDKTYAFVNDVINTATAVEYQGQFTLVLTHIPLYKPEGVCVDAPFFDFHAGGGVKEQNHLSPDASRGFLEGIFGLNGDPSAPGHGTGRRGVVLNGHDHEGCDTYHYINQTEEGEERQWRVTRWPAAKADELPGKPGVPGLREITVRSMMAMYGGNAGLLSVWFEEDTWEWKYEFVTCALGRQYFWWFVHVFDLVVLVAMVVYGALQAAVAAGFDIDKWLVAKTDAPPITVSVTANGNGVKRPVPIGNGEAMK
ncbi:hypothetical protein F4813DRAFT_394335 [Daldinia decipiens]|uniref:uncharacterized protein n=1 Tax=Daldinia decipiens TaxID=326647 RepID=UPI0020C1C412|nr:uncharacterized protein F4813DRAFT_394335 [Daldinia decipiens]KAI1652787.1 hypothetical protein F4813DRAFT_394335 [Daldinia decipiens]